MYLSKGIISFKSIQVNFFIFIEKSRLSIYNNYYIFSYYFIKDIRRFYGNNKQEWFYWYLCVKNDSVKSFMENQPHYVKRYQDNKSGYKSIKKR